MFSGSSGGGGFVVFALPPCISQLLYAWTFYLLRCLTLKSHTRRRKTLCNFESEIWLANITSCDAQSACFESQIPLGTTLASRWEGVRLPRASGKFPDFPGTFPNFPRCFSATSPEVLSLWNLTALQRFPGSFPNFPGSPPNFPGSSWTSLEVSPFLWEVWHPLLTHKNFLWFLACQFLLFVMGVLRADSTAVTKTTRVQLCHLCSRHQSGRLRFSPWLRPLTGWRLSCSPSLVSASRRSQIHNDIHSLRIYPYPMVWPLPRPWSETMVSEALLSTENPRNKGFSGSGAPIFGFGLADPAHKG